MVDGLHHLFHADMMAEQKKNVIGRVVPFYSARVGDFVRPVGGAISRDLPMRPFGPSGCD